MMAQNRRGNQRFTHKVVSQADNGHVMGPATSGNRILKQPVVLWKLSQRMTVRRH
ncbi:MAG: hypothetical protein ACYSUV_18015 [Planctomycetota bacterium]